MLCCVIGAMFLSPLYAAIMWLRSRLRSTQPAASAWTPGQVASDEVRASRSYARLLAIGTLMALGAFAIAMSGHSVHTTGISICGYSL